MSIFLSPQCSYTFSVASHLRFWYRDPKRCLLGFLKMIVVALPQICTRVFHFWNSIDLDSAWVEDSRPCQFSDLPCVLARLAMRHTYVFCVGIPNDHLIIFTQKGNAAFLKSTQYTIEHCTKILECFKDGRMMWFWMRGSHTCLIRWCVK